MCEKEDEEEKKHRKEFFRDLFKCAPKRKNSKMRHIDLM
jgi:hypothetical protein